MVFEACLQVRNLMTESLWNEFYFPPHHLALSILYVFLSLTILTAGVMLIIVVS